MTKQEKEFSVEIGGQEKVYELIISREDVEKRIKQLAEQINRDYEGKEVTVVVAMNGGMYFGVDLTRELTGNIVVDSIMVAHYGNGVAPSGEPRILSDLKTPINNKHVILVDEVVESGKSMQMLIDMLTARNPASLEVCALFAKPQEQAMDRPVKYLGFMLENNDWIIGEGCDDDQFGRHLLGAWRWNRGRTSI